MLEPPHPDLVKVALDKTTGQEFEQFALSFLAARLGACFVPMGGLYDGGADGLLEEPIYENANRSTAFMQASIEKGPASKIRKTVKRLREFGRSPKQLLYITDHLIPTLDIVEEELSEDLGIAIRIRDAQYVATHIPSNKGTVAAYYHHLHHRTDFLPRRGQGVPLAKSLHVSEPYVYTYLAGEIDRHPSGSSFSDGIVDAMIVFALEGTDPDSDKRMSESQIKSKILDHLPTAT